MKVTVVLVAICALILLNPGTTRSDELSDLKDAVQKLQKRIDDLEKKQKEEAEAVKEVKARPSPREVVAEALAKQITVGGHLKFFLADQSLGTVTTASLDDDSQHDTFAAGVNDLWLYFNKKLTDWLQITVGPQIHVSAGATPLLGSNIERSKSASVDIDLDEAYMMARLPRGFEVKAGAIYPYFSEEYATKTWWHEQYHGNEGLMTLEAWQSTGIEIYKTFEFDAFSLPVYFYPFLNGENRTFSQDDQPSRFTDNNSAKNALLHVAPEFFAFGSKVRLLGSLGGGKWDDDGKKNSYQWAAGADFTSGGLNLSGEYMYRWREDLPLLGGGNEDGEDKGWYLQLRYTLNPQWRFVLKYSDVDLWASATAGMDTQNYKVLSAGINYWITESSTIMPQFEYVNADQTGSPNELEYFRYTVGWRTTF